MTLKAKEEDLVFYGNKITSVKGEGVICRIDCFGEIEEIKNYLVNIFLGSCEKHLNWRISNKMESMDSWRFSHQNLVD